MANDEVIVRLKIASSRHTPEIITRALGLSSDRSWRVGDKRPHTIIEEKNNGWIINSGRPKATSLEEQVQALLDRVDQCKGAIKVLSRDASVEFSCVVYADTAPALNFSADIIDRLGQLGASLDIDLYLPTGSPLERPSRDAANG
jgi:hypothetical protein